MQVEEEQWIPIERNVLLLFDLIIDEIILKNDLFQDLRRVNYTIITEDKHLD